MPTHVPQPTTINGALPNTPVGAANLATGQTASISTSAVLIAPARAGPMGTGRLAAVVVNTGNVTIYVSSSPFVTSATGVSIPSGAGRTFNTTAALYALTASGSSSADVEETF